MKKKYQANDIRVNMEELDRDEMDAVEIYIKRIIDTRGTSAHDQIIHCKRERKFV